MHSHVTSPPIRVARSNHHPLHPFKAFRPPNRTSPLQPSRKRPSPPKSKPRASPSPSASRARTARICHPHQGLAPPPELSPRADRRRPRSSSHRTSVAKMRELFFFECRPLEERDRNMYEWMGRTHPARAGLLFIFDPFLKGFSLRPDEQ